VRNAKRREDPIARSTPSSSRRSKTDNINVFEQSNGRDEDDVQTMMTMGDTSWAMEAPTAFAASAPEYT
jgi:hypothetical protein